MGNALRIDPDMTVQPLELPAHEHLAALRGAVGGDVDIAVHHRHALIHTHGAGGPLGLGLNLVAWTVGSAWRRTTLPYGLYGPAVVTGPHTAGGGVAALPAALQTQIDAIAAAVRTVTAGWTNAPPPSMQSARDALLAAARRTLFP